MSGDHNGNPKLEKPKWRAFFDAVSKLLEGKVAEVEVASLKLGDQTEAEWLPLLGVFLRSTR